MNLYVPLGSSPGIGRKRPYKIGASADVEAVQSMYPYLTPHHAQTEEGDHVPRFPSRPFVTLQHHAGILACFLLPVLKCWGVVQRQPEWPTP
jgi:hypothetical protein